MKHLILLTILFLGSHFITAQSFDIVGPAGSENFGADITVLPNGNYVVIDSRWDDGAIEDVGAVYLYNGSTNALISTLRGSTVGDQVGSNGITVLSNGNYVVRSPFWNNGRARDAGAVTWRDGDSAVSGVVSITNSLVGSTSFDQVGNRGVIALSNGNYVVISSDWNNGLVRDVGAVTWGNGKSGIVGEVSATNSLVGSSTFDQVGVFGVTALNNGNYVVRSPFLDNGADINVGAVTWGNGTSGVIGAVSITNSLMGSTAFDQVGSSGLTALSNSNYVVSSSFWDDGVVSDVGAVTWSNGTNGIIGTVSANNSLVGSTADDRVGIRGIIALSNGNYVVGNPLWNNGIVSDVGAVTWGNGTSGIIGAVNIVNSLVGSSAFDQVGSGITALSNGNYVVSSSSWDNLEVIDVGAVTWGNGTSGTIGLVSTTNSLVGSTAFDQVGSSGITALSNGNYVVSSPSWDNLEVRGVGAVTWGNGTSGVIGTISATNSLVGSSAFDQVGSSGITALSNGNYVVSSSSWNNGIMRDAGAVTWGNGTSGTIGLVSPTNSLVGGTASDQVSSNGVIALSNNNYVVSSDSWDNGIMRDVGAVTWGNGTSGTIGLVSPTNSLVGSTALDRVGRDGVTVLNNSNYVVRSQFWNNELVSQVGAVTWGDGNSGVIGAVSIANSLVGSKVNDRVGNDDVVALGNGDYIVSSDSWDNMAVSNAGAVTLGNGIASISSFINSCNSVLGNITNQGRSIKFAFNELSTKLLVGKPAENIITIYNQRAIALAGDLDNKILSISGSGEADFITEDCELIASLTTIGSSPISGNTAATVWVADAQPTNYAKRYYEVFPDSNSTTATGKLSLYFTQAEFDDFNVVSSVKLPQNPSDTIGVANLIVEKRLGKSNDGTGLPDSYLGEVSEIDLDDNNVLWNAQEMRWEVSFDVTGWGGFFLKAKVATIPDISTVEFDLCNQPFTASFDPIENAIAYQVEITIPTLNNRVITRRINEAIFSGNFNIPNRVLGSEIELRIAAIFFDEDTGEETIGEFSESGTFVLECEENGNLILENRSHTFTGLQLYPNPTSNTFTVAYNSLEGDNLKLQILDFAGKVVFEENNRLQTGENRSTYWIGHLVAGTYILKVQSGQRVEQVKLVKL